MRDAAAWIAVVIPALSLVLLANSALSAAVVEASAARISGVAVAGRVVVTLALILIPLEFMICTGNGPVVAVEDADVLIIDDIFDSGQTMTALIHAIKEKKPRSIKSLVLLIKNVPRTTQIRPDYVLFEIENEFVVGYGLDYKERYRNLSGIFILEEP